MKTLKVTLDNKSTIRQRYEYMEEAIDFLLKLEEEGHKFSPENVEWNEV